MDNLSCLGSVRARFVRMVVWIESSPGACVEDESQSANVYMSGGVMQENISTLDYTLCY